MKDSDVIVISVNSQGLRGLMRELQPFELKNKIFVLCMKGVEIENRHAAFPGVCRGV